MSKILAGCFITVYWTGGVWSRVELGYHTWNQCLGGVVLGAGWVKVWYGIWMTSPMVREGLQVFIDTVWAGSIGRLVR